ncbi:hypothetical protein ANTHELSMS3_04337 [Antarctobacter heliothermus]|uniref:Uncharacterized protein n=1 Tax=Antarctobacter heliothermus TaxID=74033 RepID=A0A222EAF9_9RHOB|nr:hypothetical protein ANTHELSMS3_04337 [Antarctobacter heliothermus]
MAQLATGTTPRVEAITSIQGIGPTLHAGRVATGMFPLAGLGAQRQRSGSVATSAGKSDPLDCEWSLTFVVREPARAACRGGAMQPRSTCEPESS